MSQKQRIVGTHHKHPLPHVRSGSTYALGGAALVLALTVIGLPVDLALGGDSTSAISALLIVGEITSLLVLIFATLARRGAKKSIPKILTDAQTVHWTYTPTEWQHFTAQAWRRSLRGVLLLTSILWGVALFVALIIFATSQDAFNAALGLAIGTGLAVIVGLLFGLQAAVLWQRRRRVVTSDVYIHRAGVILGGWYYPLGGGMRPLNKVTFKAGDLAMLRFDIGSGRGRYTFEVPVPKSREADAERLTHRF